MAASSLLAKLEPEAMASEGGLKRASIAVRLLESKAAENAAALSAELAQADGAFVLMQTALLHPLPSLRRGASCVLSACVRSGEPTFTRQALSRRLTVALVRVVCEETRRVPKGMEGMEGMEELHEDGGDPELPVRREALCALSTLLTSAQTRDEVLSDANALPTMVIACTHTDPTLQMTALTTLEALAGADANTLAKVVEVVEDDAPNFSEGLLTRILNAAEMLVPMKSHTEWILAKLAVGSRKLRHVAETWQKECGRDSLRIATDEGSDEEAAQQTESQKQPLPQEHRAAESPPQPPVQPPPPPRAAVRTAALRLLSALELANKLRDHLFTKDASATIDSLTPEQLQPADLGMQLATKVRAWVAQGVAVPEVPEAQDDSNV